MIYSLKRTKETKGEMKKALAQLFDENLVFCLHAENQRRSFSSSSWLLWEEREIVTFLLSKRLLEREKAFPTGLIWEFLCLMLNVAIPHTDIKSINLTENVVVISQTSACNLPQYAFLRKPLKCLSCSLLSTTLSARPISWRQLMDFFN